MSEILLELRRENLVARIERECGRLFFRVYENRKRIKSEIYQVSTPVLIQYLKAQGFKGEKLTKVERDILLYLEEAWRKYSRPLKTVHTPWGYNAFRFRCPVRKKRLNEEHLENIFNKLVEKGYLKVIQKYPLEPKFYALTEKGRFVKWL